MKRIITNFFWKLFFYSAAIFIFFISSKSFATYSWKQKSDLPTLGRHESAAFSIGTHGYFATGDDGNVCYKDLWEWDLGTNIWTQKADLPGIERYGAFGFAINGMGYVGTGWTNTSSQLKDFYQYDPVANIWTQKTDFGGAARYDAVGLSNGVNGYVGFGFAPNHNDWWEYNPVTDTWSARTNFPGTARQSLTGFTIGTDVYVGTGSTAGGTLFNDFWKFTPATNSWVQLANFPGAARYADIGFTINGEGYIGAGGDGLGTYYNDFYKYDPGSNTWTAIAPWPAVPRNSGDGFSIGVNGYAGLGITSPGGWTFYHDFWEYSPDSVNQTLASFSAPNTICPGTCIDFTNQSQGATTYQWSFTGGNPSSSSAFSPASICYNSPGIYDVTLIASGAFGSDTLTINNYITVYPYPAPQGINQNGDTLFAYAGSSFYQWYQDGLIIPGATNYFLIAPASGNYNVVATDSNGCEVEAVIYDVIADVSSIAFDAEWAMSVYPNPFHGKTNFTITTKKNGNVRLEIFDLRGKLIEILFDGQLAAGEKRELEFNGSVFPNAVYQYRITSGTHLMNGRLILIK